MKIKIENWNGHSIRFVEKNPGDWWAVAKDVSSALAYRDAHGMVRMLDNKDRGTHIVSTPSADQEMLIISEFGIYDAIFNSRKPEAKTFKRWVFDVIKELREASGFEAFQVFRMLDKDHQKEAMRRLRDGMYRPVRVDFIKANTVANKAVSSIYGHSKMIKKDQMTPDMLVQRQVVLDDIVDLMAVNESFDLGLSVSKAVYGKYCER